jgi:hypothetical protein
MRLEFAVNCFRGICKSCQKHLNTITITEEEFQTLQCAFMDRVVVGKDVFRNTTPEEIKGFLHFVKMTAPYDMVIDGLNVAFAGGSKKTLSLQSQARAVSIITVSTNLCYISFLKQQFVITHWYTILQETKNLTDP